MTRGAGDPKRWLQVSVLSWLLVASAVAGASGIVGGEADAGSVSTASSAAEQSGTPEATTTTESRRPLDPRFDFACEQVAVTARGYDSVTLVFADDERQTFRWSFRGRNVFFGTGENVGAVVTEVVVRRDGERVTRRNPSFEACIGRPATATTTGPPATAVDTATTATPVTTATAATTTTSSTPATATATVTIGTLDLTTFVETTTAGTTQPEATARETTTVARKTPTVTRATTTVTRKTTTVARKATAVPTPTVTPQPIAGFPECSDEEFGLTHALSLTYEGGAFTGENATEIGENRFRFTVENETYEVELVEVERDEAGDPVSVTFDATLSVDAVVVRGGPGANVYEFPAGVSRRADLRAPTDENTGQSFAVEEVAFCYDPETPNRAENAGGPLDGVGLGLLVGRDATAAVGLAAAGLLVVRRRRDA